VEILKGSFDADLPRGREGIQIKSASRTRFRTQGEGFQNVGATANSPVANHVYPVADSIYDLGELVEWAPRPVELTSAVIGHHDSGRTDVQSTLCVRNTHDAFEAELFAPFLSDALGIFPVHRLVEHCAKIIADRYRDIRTLLHIVFQLGQRKLLVREVVDRPSRVQGEAEETLESQARW
jgi:hypothetical protein